MTIQFYLHDRSKSDHRLIMLRIYDGQFKNRKFIYSTKEHIEPQLWDADQQEAKKGYESLNVRLSELKSAATKFILTNRPTLTSELLRAHLDSLRPQEAIKERGRSLLDEWKDYLVSMKSTIARRTFASYTNACASFEAFLSDKEFLKERGVPISIAMTPTELNYRIYQSYQVWMISAVKVRNRQGEVIRVGYSHNTISKRNKILKMTFNHLKKVKAIPTDVSLDYIKTNERPGLQISLSQDELRKIAKHEFLTQRLNRIRDLFVLQCITGLRISDFLRLDQNLREKNKVEIEMKKTKKRIEFVITPAARAILEKYDYNLPTISEQKYREGIKDVYQTVFPNSSIQKREGDKFVNVPIWTEISSHDAIRTFVNISTERGMSLPSIAKITGKTLKVLSTNYIVESQKVAQQQLDKAWGEI